MDPKVTTTEADFRAWYQRTSPRVYAYVRRYSTEADCDDVIAEVYLTAWRRFDDLPADSVPWLIGTARNVLANSWRARGKRQRLTAELVNLTALADLLRAISRLGQSDQEVLLLAGWDGLDSAGLATALGCSTTAARARLSRARRRLADGLDARTKVPSPLLQLIPERN
jgi:RNA polymerase sigma-70 factor (ECF subfamily)